MPASPIAIAWRSVGSLPSLAASFKSCEQRRLVSQFTEGDGREAADAKRGIGQKCDQHLAAGGAALFIAASGSSQGPRGLRPNFGVAIEA